MAIAARIGAAPRTTPVTESMRAYANTRFLQHVAGALRTHGQNSVLNADLVLALRLQDELLEGSVGAGDDAAAARRHTPRRPNASSLRLFPKPSPPSTRGPGDLRPNLIPHALPQPRRRRTDADRTETQLDLVIPTNSELPLLPRMHVLAAAYAASVTSAEHALSDPPVSRH
ncbi:hypothetical protein B0H16DRAFT_1884101 [Mycena metata]|uniref:Uncharacterized protein n=1 Tax=Mycena metata TaxID=1033252 RepID=A0AAD7JHJ3_9AGAR|nr:hypothetical protein B0H16DRAFT_1884101 [Mycena metata]